jgi:alpha-L-glutamate ligase-like protein
MNARNASYTLRYNPRRLYPRVDDKLESKRLCQAVGVAVPRTLAVVRYQYEVGRLPEALASEVSFVVKPVHGAMGNGILVVLGRDGDAYVRSGSRRLSAAELRFHASSILSGLYALAGQPDVVMVEERLEVHPALGRIAVEGVPDVRVVVYRGVPVMAMTRLPTRASDGRANLHQGAVGAGVDLSTGRIVRAVHYDRFVEAHPDSGETIPGVVIPEFARLLALAVRAADTTGLGYVGADLVLDARQGPVVLELNARPGLAIQLANGAGLVPRLERVDAEVEADMELEDRMALGRRIAAACPGLA